MQATQARESKRVVTQGLPPLFGPATAVLRSFMACHLWPAGQRAGEVTLADLDWPAFVEASASSEGPRLVAGVRPARLPPPEGAVATLASAGARIDSARAGLYSELGR